MCVGLAVVPEMEFSGYVKRKSFLIVLLHVQAARALGKQRKMFSVLICKGERSEKNVFLKIPGSVDNECSFPER